MIFCVVTPCYLVKSALCHNPEDSSMSAQRHERLGTYVVNLCCEIMLGRIHLLENENSITLSRNPQEHNLNTHGHECIET
jgi:hypothetical protein